MSGNKEIMRGIHEAKLKSFSIGTMGRRGPSKKEQEQLKKKQDEEEVGKVYQEFVSTFQDAPSSKISKTWVKAGTFNAGSRKEDFSEKGKLYKPSSRVDLGASDNRGGQTSSLTPETNQKRPDKPGKKKQMEKKKSNLEMFKEELKARQEERLERHRIKNVIRGTKDSDGLPARGDSLKPFLSEPRDPGGHDTGDPNTTNVYLGNLCPKLTEQELMELFGKFGPLASIKIMWPRTEDEKARGRHCGFVAYMARPDAERAMKNLLGKMISGFEMKMGWGKPVPIPMHPIYIPPALLKLTMPPEPNGLPFNCQPDSQADLDKWRGIKLTPNDAEYASFSRMIRLSTVKVCMPVDRTQLCLINRMVEFVIREGPVFEAIIMSREINNPMFKFLFENASPEHIYYRWRLYSLLQGDSRDDWRTEEFRLFKGGSMWRPPTVSMYTQGMPEILVNDQSSVEKIERKREKPPKASVDKGGLSSSQRERFEDMLRTLMPDRNPLAETMVWCIEHADAWEEIVDCISESLSQPQTPVARKIARLYLISDILHNCSVKVSNVSYYRKGFEVKLPEIFNDLNVTYKNIEARTKAEAFRQRVSNCFRAWEDWALYPQDYLIKLQNIFLGLVGGDEESDKNDEDVTPGREDDLDGKPLHSDDDEDVDGVPLDGAAFLKNAQKAQRNSDNMKFKSGKLLPAGFAPSKWESVDQKTVEAQAVTSKWDIFDQQLDEKRKSITEPDDDEDIDGVPMQDDDEGASSHDIRMSEDRRARLREIEMKVMCYQDELESGKQPSKPGWTISEQVEQYRKKLMRRNEPDVTPTYPMTPTLVDDYGSESGGDDDDGGGGGGRRGREHRKSRRSSSRSRSRSRERKRKHRRRHSSASSSSSEDDRKKRRRSRSKSPRKHKKKRR